MPRTSFVGEPLDPHQLVGQDFGISLEDFLLNSRIIECERLLQSEFGSGSIRLVLATPKGSGKVELNFGEKNRYLPVRVTRLNNDGAILEEKRFEYQLVPSRNALMLQTARTVFRVDPSASEGMRLISFVGEQFFTVDEFTLLAEGDIDRLRIRPGENWLVQDLTKREEHVRKLAEKEALVASKRSLNRLILLANGCVAVIFLVVVFRKKIPFFRKNCSSSIGD